MGKAIGIILSAGSGTRFKSEVPKQYCLVNGKEMISYSIDAFRQSSRIDDFIILVDKNEFESGRVERTYGVRTVLGGSSRNESFKKALDYIHDNYPDCEKIIENNAACPMITSALLDEYIDLLDEYDFVETTYPITDALGAYDGRIANREDFYLIQAPDAYRFGMLYDNFDENSPLCHPAHQLPASAKGYKYFGYEDNYKVTYPDDISIVEMRLNKRNRTADGE